MSRKGHSFLLQTINMVGETHQSGFGWGVVAGGSRIFPLVDLVI